MIINGTVYTWRVHVNAKRGWRRWKLVGQAEVNKKAREREPPRRAVTTDHRSAKTVAAAVAVCARVFFIHIEIPKRLPVAIAISKFILPLRRRCHPLHQHSNSRRQPFTHSVFVRHLQKRLVILFSPTLNNSHRRNKCAIEFYRRDKCVSVVLLTATADIILWQLLKWKGVERSAFKIRITFPFTGDRRDCLINAHVWICDLKPALPSCVEICA